MKKKILLVAAFILIILLPIVINLILKTSNSDITEGTYYAVDCEAFPDAYIEVKGQTIQFYNIDLNEIYGDSQFDVIYQAQIREENPFDTGFTIEELKQMSDLNSAFCENSYTYNADKVQKQGTFVFWYPCMTEGQLFGIQLLYDSWEDTLKINNYQMNILFEKK